MFKYLVSAALIAAAGMVSAQSADPQPTPTADTHKAYDQKIRDCRKKAADQGLQGEERRAFVAKCLKG